MREVFFHQISLASHPGIAIANRRCSGKLPNQITLDLPRDRLWIPIEILSNHGYILRS